MANEERKYWVKESWRFNLESAGTHLWCIAMAVERGERQLPMKICGRTLKTIEDIMSFKDRCDDLAWTATGKVTGKEFGEMKKIVEWRINERYCANVEAGNKFAEDCFLDL